MEKLNLGNWIQFLLFFYLSLSVQAQDKATAYEDYILIFGENDIDFEINEAPAEFLENDYVILGQKTYLNYRMDKMNKLNILGLTRKRIKILNATALETFSEIYYQKGMEIDILVIKNDSTRFQVDDSNAIEVENNVPKIYQSQFYNESYVKIAVPNLEVGDIIDFIKEYDYSRSSTILEYITSSASDAPIVFEKLIIDTSNDYLNSYAKSFNGAPKFKSLAGQGLNDRGEISKRVHRMVYEDSMSPKRDNKLWSREYENYPYYKLSIIPKLMKYEADAKINHRSYFDIADNYYDDYDKATKAQNIFIDKKRMKTCSDEKKVETIYNSIRLYFLLLVAENSTIQSGVTNDIWKYSRNFSQMSDVVFQNIFRKLLKKHKVPFECVVALSDYYGDPKDAFTLGEMKLGTYIKSIDKYYWILDTYSYPTEIPYSFRGSTIYKYESGKHAKDKTLVSEEKLMPLKPEQNLYHVTTEIKIENKKDLVYDQLHKFTGYYKVGNASTFLYNSEMVLDIYDKMSLKQNSNFEGLLKAFETGKYTKSQNKAYETFKDNELKKEERIKKWYKEFNATELEEYYVQDIGIASDKDTMIISSKYRSDKCLKKAGKNIIVPFEQLIGENLKLTSEDLEQRTVNVHLKYAKKIVNIINLTIPDGYDIANLEDFNFEIDNDIASYSCSVKINGAIAKFESTKIYKKAKVSPEDFTKLTDMVTSAYDMSKKSVVLALD